LKVDYEKELQKLKLAEFETMNLTRAEEDRVKQQ
jgi:hypothetical protein